jgi:hypothetical protein
MNHTRIVFGGQVAKIRQNILGKKHSFADHQQFP